MLIVVEGLDSVGKSTFINNLSDKLRQELKLDNNQQIEIYREPGGTHLGEYLRGVLKSEKSQFIPLKKGLNDISKEFLSEVMSHNKELQKVLEKIFLNQVCLYNEQLPLTSLEELLLFNAARSQLVNDVLINHQDKIIILDRFYYSTIAYQGYGRQMDLNLVNDICQKAVGNLTIDYVFYLHLSLDERQKRIENRNKEINVVNDRIESSSDNFFRRAYQGFEELNKTQENFIKIQANQSPGKMVKDALNSLRL